MNTKRRLTQEDKENILKEFNGINAKEISLKYPYSSYGTIFRFLKKQGLQLKGKGLNNKGNKRRKNISLFETEIINAFINENASIEDLRKKYKTSCIFINELLKKNKIEPITRNEASIKCRAKHGATKGFSGREHSEKSKEKTSLSLIEQYEKGNKEPKQLKSKTYNTIYGNFLGTYEVAYFRKLIEEKNLLPNKCHGGIKTPFGIYFPDFEFEDKFIEVKSLFTYKVMIGEEKGFDKQYKHRKQKDKIDWVSLNTKPIEIFILDKNEAEKYFDMEINNPIFLKDKVIKKYKQYFKQ